MDNLVAAEISSLLSLKMMPNSPALQTSLINRGHPFPLYVPPSQAVFGQHLHASSQMSEENLLIRNDLKAGCNENPYTPPLPQDIHASKELLRMRVFASSSTSTSGDDGAESNRDIQRLPREGPLRVNTPPMACASDVMAKQGKRCILQSMHVPDAEK
ncbi:hypothetical protein FIBSPDRAFT_926549 [Athelia psychrophila]|uniref:Uncharacterized protein n=1 Tax=Athelia psychrophila TaxID=1759441 RepID=A0A166TAZ6_9AGAM|nr:hypothetical protein FIBSPDRAFT_926549 [Fibularhizoctonia sp. CBS 109695]